MPRSFIKNAKNAAFFFKKCKRMQRKNAAFFYKERKRMHAQPWSLYSTVGPPHWRTTQEHDALNRLLDGDYIPSIFEVLQTSDMIH